MPEEKLLCFRTRGVPEPWTLARYHEVGGYRALRKIIEEKIQPADIIETLKAANLRGRGGAGFPTGLKWSFVNRDLPGDKYLISNCDESEPGTCKDREIMLINPHQLIEGMIIGGYVLGAKVGYNFLRGEFQAPFRRLEQALGEARAEGYLGDGILGSDIHFQLHNHYSGGAYICGEETALMDSLEGKRGMPRVKPPFPANYGLYGKPSNVNNTETVATVPVIIEKGAQWFSEVGTPKSGGTKIFSVSGHVNKPGNYEIPMGMPFKDLLALAGGIWKDRQLKAVIPGGSSMPVLPAAVIMQTDMDYESIAEAGSMLGSGGMMVMDDHTCMVKALLRLMQFYMHESCGQCTPCREGSGWTYRLVKKIADGRGEFTDIDQLERVVAGIEGRTICVFGEAIAWPVQGFLRHFRHEFLHYIEHKRSVLDS